jgi:putative sugar O-methyltransferase
MVQSTMTPAPAVKHPDATPTPMSIEECPELLDAMVRDGAKQAGLYQPGPYWKTKTRAAASQIKRLGLNGFRNFKSGVGTSFADNVFVDMRSALDAGRGRPVKFLFEHVFPFSTVMNGQVALTRGYAQDALALTAARVGESAETRDLLSKYEMPYSLLGDCVATTDFEGRPVSLHYLKLLQLIDRVGRHAPLDQARSLLEIGGGFGANVHLLLELFPKLRKVVYLDIPPNLYVGSCYLRSFYGSAVRDYRQTRLLERVEFKDDDSLEIIAICPWQIEALDLSIDVFWNAHSFVEMPWGVVKNYAKHVLSLGKDGEMCVALASYGGGGPDTIAPERLPTAFPGREFAADEFWLLGWPIATRRDPERDEVSRISLFVSAH